MSKPNEPKKKILPKLRIVFFFLLIIYIIFLLGKTVWQNFDINHQIGSLEDEINQLEEENKKLDNQMKYYQSTTYKEQEARLKLGYQKPGEKVYVLPNQGKNQETQSESSNNSENKDTRPNYLKWWEFLFK